MELKDIINRPLIATIGFFDGVHLGHKYLIQQLLEIANLELLPSAVITFPVHPRRVLSSEFQPALLCGYNEKIIRLSETGLDYCIPIDFSVELSQLSSKDFIQRILKNKLNVNTLLIGYDHRFGYNRLHGFEDYVEYGKEVGMKIVLAHEFDSDQPISSSNIRRLLSEGDIDAANSMLGYRYSISGKIIEGFKVGRTIGFPTANIQIWENFKVIPAFGVYAVYVNIESCQYKGMLYIGKRPTLHNGDNISLEVNIFGFDGDLYGKSLTVELVKFVRSDEKFSNLDSLVQQIHKDKIDVEELLK